MRARTVAVPLVIILIQRPLRNFSSRFLRWATRKLKRADRFDGLENVVSYSARLIAAIRAVESEKGEGALFTDPLAHVLAGSKALAAKRETEAARLEAHVREGKAGKDAPRSAGRIQVRTLYFDDAVRVAVGAVDLSSTPALAGSTGHISAAFAKGDRPLPTALKAMGHAVKQALQGGWCRQVVLLGAGMDTRAWRLDLPGGVTWVEVDQADVLASKARAMTIMGASLGGPATATTATAATATATAATATAATATATATAPTTAVPAAATATATTAAVTAADSPSPSSAAAAAAAATDAASTTTTATTSDDTTAAPTAARCPFASLFKAPPPWHPAIPGPDSSAVAVAGSSGGGSSTGAAAGSGKGRSGGVKFPVKFPLRAGRYAAHAADLQQPGWADALVTSGALDPKLPTLWVLEGLTYYLEPASVPIMLGEIGKVSPAGSALVASIASAATVARVQAKKRGDGDAMGAWKWGAPGGPEQWAKYFESHMGAGWSVVGSPFWEDVAPQYGLVPDSGVYSRLRRGAAGAGQTNGPSGQTNGPAGQTNGPEGVGAPGEEPRGGYVTAVRLCDAGGEGSDGDL